MIHAYDKVYLEAARVCLASMLDYAVYDLEYDLKQFFDLFITTGVAGRFGTGDYTVLVGKSGVEVAWEVLERSGLEVKRVEPKPSLDRSEEYWVGWALAYYQWETNLSFDQIVRYIPIDIIRALYMPYHEMDIRQFVDRMNELYLAAKPETNLKIHRRWAGLSQRQLAEESGVPLRTLQQYEQGRKDINKARAEYVLALAQVLSCRPEELIERITKDS